MIQNYEPDPKFLGINETGPVYDPGQQLRYDIMTPIEFYGRHPLPRAATVMRLVIGLLIMAVLPEGILFCIGLLQLISWMMDTGIDVWAMTLLGFLLMILFSLAGGLIFSVGPGPQERSAGSAYVWRAWLFRGALVHLAIWCLLVTVAALMVVWGNTRMPQLGTTILGGFMVLILAPGLMIISLGQYFKILGTMLPLRIELKSLSLMCWIIYINGLTCWFPLWLASVFGSEYEAWYVLAIVVTVAAGISMFILLLTFWFMMMQVLSGLFHLWRNLEEISVRVHSYRVSQEEA